MAATTISHRELRKDSGRILRAVQAGESSVVTNAGEPVAILAHIGSQQLAGVRHQPRFPGARFADVVPHPGRPDETALASLLELQAEQRSSPWTYR